MTWPHGDLKKADLIARLTCQGSSLWITFTPCMYVAKGATPFGPITSRVAALQGGKRVVARHTCHTLFPEALRAAYKSMVYDSYALTCLFVFVSTKGLDLHTFTLAVL